MAEEPQRLLQGIHDLHAAFVSGAVAKCKAAADAVEGAHAALLASGQAQERLLEATVAAQQAAVTKALAAAQEDIAAMTRWAAVGLTRLQQWRWLKEFGVSSFDSTWPSAQRSICCNTCVMRLLHVDLLKQNRCKRMLPPSMSLLPPILGRSVLAAVCHRGSEHCRAFDEGGAAADACRRAAEGTVAAQSDALDAFQRQFDASAEADQVST